MIDNAKIDEEPNKNSSLIWKDSKFRQRIQESDKSPQKILTPSKVNSGFIIFPGQRIVEVEDFRSQQQFEIFDPISIEMSKILQEGGLWAGYRLDYHRKHNMLKIRRKKMKKHKHRKRLRKRRYQNRVIQST